MTRRRAATLHRTLAVLAGMLLVVPVLSRVTATDAASPSPAFVQATGSTTANKFAFTRPVTAGDLLVVGITTNDGGTEPITGVSDSLNGTWARAVSVRYGNGHVELYYVANSAPGTASVTVAGGRGAFTAAEYSGAAGLDQVVARATTASPSAGPTPALVGAGELVVGIGGMTAPGTFTAGTGFTLRTAAVSNYTYAAGLEDLVASSSAGQSMTMRSSTSGYAGAVVAAFAAAPRATPTAVLAVSPSSGAAPLTVTADASGSSDPTGITGYTFNFGDGSAPVGPQPGATATHTFAAGGTFTVTATVADPGGSTASATQTVRVGAPAAALTVTPSSGAVPLSVTADASASTDPLGITTYAFAFGDGTVVGPQAGAQATHTYAGAGAYTVTVTVADAVGATATASRPVSAVTPPRAALTLTPSTGPTPLAVTADASGSTAGTNPIASYTFAFGDGTSVGPQSGAQALHTYSSSGTFTVQVTLTDTGGTTATATGTVTAVAPPTASLTVTPATGSAPLAVTADGSGSTPGNNPIATYTFAFGDGTTVGPRAGAQAAHTYTTAGTYTVTLTVTDSAGFSSSATQTVRAATPPSASLTVTPATGTTPLVVTADASGSTAGTNPIASYTFDFGDGTLVGPQSSTQALHTYAAGGTFTVTLTATDAAGTRSTATATVTAVAPPTASLTVSPSTGATPLPVSADASGSAAGSNPIASYTFAFGDGTTVGPQAGAQASHTYPAAGTYTVTVTVTDTAGSSATATRSVTAVRPPSAALSVTPANGAVPLPVTADASASTAGSNPIASYTFNFGDGTFVGPQSSAQAVHTYAAGGVYTVSLTVTDTAGTAGTASQSVTAAAPPTAALAVTPASGGVPLMVTADASGSAAGSYPISSYTFSFGDGTSAGPQTGSQANHTFTAAGTYTVTVTVTDSAGMAATASRTVTAASAPSAALRATPATGPAPLTVTADASASTAGSRPIATYMFDFGDGTALVGPQAAATATHLYPVAGNYTLTVTVADSGRVSSTATAAVGAVAPPTAVLVVSPTSGYAPLSVAAGAANSAAGSYPMATYTFDFGDGTVVGPQGSQSAAHTYLAIGPFTVTLTVTDTQGYTGSATASVTVSSGVVARDTFQRPNQNGWGTASNGTNWGPAGSGLSIAGNEGVIGYSGSSQFETLGSTTIADADGLARFSIAATSDPFGIILRAQPNGNMYLGRYDGAGHLQFEYRVGSSWTHVSLTNFTPTANAFYWLRFRAQGQNLYLKAWPSGTAEPSAWNWSGTSSGITAAGQMGVYGYANSGAPVQVDSFSVSAVGNPAPNSSITGTVTDSVSGAGVSGVTVSTLPVTVTATTNASGAYNLATQAGTYTVVFTAGPTGHNSNFVGNVQAPALGSVAVPNQALVPIPAQTAMDAFTQPDQTNGWGTSTDGNVWASDLGVYPGAQAGISNRQAWVDTQASATTDFDTWMGYQYQNQQVTMDLNITSVLVDPNYQHGARVLARVQNSTTWVLMTINPTAQDLELWATLNNNWTLLVAVSQPVSTNTWYHVKLAVIGTQVMGKIWAFAAAEPGWLVTANQGTVNGTGAGGTRTTGAFVQYANFAQTPITQISGTVTASSTGAPVANATVSAGAGLATVTDSRGNYTLSGLVGGQAYTVTSSAAGYQSSGASTASVTPATATTATANLVLTG